MSHPNPEFKSRHHQGAHQILMQSSIAIQKHLDRLNDRNNLNLTNPPTLDDLASALKLDDLRASGELDRPGQES